MAGKWRWRVLLVDDHAIFRETVRYVLAGDSQFEVMAEAGDGEEAVALAQQIELDLVLMDIILRGDLDGIDAASEIKARFNVPVVFLTALNDQETFERAIKTKPLGWMAKPVETRRLQQVIEKALSQQPKPYDR